MTIEVGSTLPDATFRSMVDGKPAEVTTGEVFAGKKVVLFAVPGAFTPTCTMNHLPGFLDNLDHIKGKGIDEVAVVAVNDAFVMDAWAKASGGKDKIRFLADSGAGFTKAIGLDVDLGAVLGLRSKRYSMIVHDGIVIALNVEDAPGKAEISGAARLIEQL